MKILYLVLVTASKNFSKTSYSGHPRSCLAGADFDFVSAANVAVCLLRLLSAIRGVSCHPACCPVSHCFP